MSRIRHVFRQLDAPLRRTRQFAAFVDLRHVDRRMMRISCSVVVLIAADAGDEDVVVELVQSSLVDVAADTRVAAELQTAVILDVILHEEAVVVWIIAAEWIDGCRHIELAPLDQQRLAVHHGSFRIARVSFPRYTVLIFIEVLERLGEVVAAVFLDVSFEVDNRSSVLNQIFARSTYNANLPEIISRQIDIFVASRCRMHVRHGSRLASCHRRRRSLGIWID